MPQTEAARTWRIVFSDHSAPKGQRAFPVRVQWFDDSNYESLKSELACQLLERAANTAE
jgi:hypothetical protein